MVYDGSTPSVDGLCYDAEDNIFEDGQVVNGCIKDFSPSLPEQSLKEYNIKNTNDKKFRIRLVPEKVVYFSSLHVASVYGAYLLFTSAKWQSDVFALFLYFVSNVGWTAGPHRLWSHRSYKATLPLRIILAFMFTISFQEDIFRWARNHRVHHKFSDTDADPHNSKRGFFFCHIGWQMSRKHPDVTRKGNTLDFSDLLADPVVRFHRKYYYYLIILCCFIIPTIVPMYLWNETFSNSFFVCVVLRLCLAYHGTFLVNSAAHYWGYRPYNLHIRPRENILVSWFATGEGFHNYHHTFPYDYAASEFGTKYNMATAFIDLMAWLGLAYDLKTANSESIESCKLKTGENSLKLRENGEVKTVKEE